MLLAIYSEPMHKKKSLWLNERKGLKHLYLWMRAHNFPAPYLYNYIPGEKMEVLRWIGDNLVFPCELGGLQLLLLGSPDQQKSLLMELLSQSLRVYFVPLELKNFTGAERK